MKVSALTRRSFCRVGALEVFHVKFVFLASRRFFILNDIFRAGFHPPIQVPRGPRIPMSTHGIGPYHEKSNPVVG